MFLYINERCYSYLSTKQGLNTVRVRAPFSGEKFLWIWKPLEILCFCAQKGCQDVILQFHLKNQMNKQSALMNIVPELHIENKSRDSLLSASAQRYFAGNLHHNAWLPIGLNLIKQTRGSAFFIDSIFSDGWIYFCLKITLFCSWAIENILPVTAASAVLCHLFPSMCVEMIPFVNLEMCQWHGWE